MRQQGYVLAGAVVGLCAALWGCSNNDQTTTAAPPATAAPATTPPGPGGAASMPPMMASAGGDLTPTPVIDKKIAELKAGKDKKALAAAYADRGYAKMTDEAAGPRVKYRAALADFRLALVADPMNAKAKEYKTTIEDIYKSMGRPVPTGP